MRDPFGLDVGATVRAVRRRADLDQRTLARAAGVPLSTLSRIESGAVAEPRITTVDRLVRTAGFFLVVVDADELFVAPLSDGPRDAAGRRYPAHLDVRPTHGRDWWGWFWCTTYPPRVPVHTYDLSRWRRDARRSAEQQPQRDEDQADTDPAEHDR